MGVRVDERRTLMHKLGTWVIHGAFPSLICTHAKTLVCCTPTFFPWIGNVYTLLIAGYGNAGCFHRRCVRRVPPETTAPYHYNCLFSFVSRYLQRTCWINRVGCRIRSQCRMYSWAFTIGILTTSQNQVWEDYYDKPEVYKPSRWYTTQNVESELFSRKFAIIEADVFLLRDWRVEQSMKTDRSEAGWIEWWSNGGCYGCPAEVRKEAAAILRASIYYPYLSGLWNRPALLYDHRRMFAYIRSSARLNNPGRELFHIILATLFC